MKCPHCNQEHTEGTKYCPYTGEEIPASMQSCPNPDCVNYGRSILPNDYKFCPVCRAKLGIMYDVMCNDCIRDMALPEKKFIITILYADESIVPDIGKIAGKDILTHVGLKKLPFTTTNTEDIFPYTLYDGEGVIESKALSIKKQLETLGAKVELLRLNSSTVEDFRKGRIFVNNIVLGETGLQELLTKKYRKEYEESLKNWMEEDTVWIPFEASENVDAKVLYLNPDVESSGVAEIQQEFEEMFVNPSDANFSFVENPNQVVNYIETNFDALPCFIEMGIDDDVFFVNEEGDLRPADDVERSINDILISNGWVKINNFLKPKVFCESRSEELKATYRCMKTDDGNTVIMLLFVSTDHYFGGWYNCRVVFAVNLIK